MSKNGARILVVDDEIEIVHALQRSLAAHGYNVLTAGTHIYALLLILHKEGKATSTRATDVS